MLHLAHRARPAPGELERPLVCFRSGVAEEHLVRERPFDERRRETPLWRGLVQIRDVYETVGGRVHRRDEPLVTVAERVHGDSAHEIEVALALGVDEIDAFSAHELLWRALVGAQHRVRRLADVDDRCLRDR